MSFFVSDSLKDKISETELAQNFDDSLSLSNKNLILTVADTTYQIHKILFKEDSRQLIVFILDTFEIKSLVNSMKESNMTIEFFGENFFITKDSVKIKSIERNEKDNLFTLKILISDLGEQNV